MSTSAIDTTLESVSLFKEYQIKSRNVKARKNYNKDINIA